jgi:hypothetical protein
MTRFLWWLLGVAVEPIGRWLRRKSGETLWI